MDPLLCILLLLLTSPPPSSSSTHTHPLLFNKPFRPLNPPTIPSSPVQWQSNSCLLNLSPQILSTLKQSCMGEPFISRRTCCPALAAWLMAASAQSILTTIATRPANPPSLPSNSMQPLLPDDSISCATTMKAVLASHGIPLHFPNPATCSAMTCFCGLRLKGIQCEAIAGSLDVHNQTSPLEVECRRHSYIGCARCLEALQQGMEGVLPWKGSARQELDCKLIQLMQLLLKNSTLYIPTVSALLRALLYDGQGAPRCSPGWRYMPLAVDSSRLHPSAAPPAQCTLPSSAAALFCWVLLLLSAIAVRFA